MNLPEEPSTFRRADPPELPWHWRFEDAAGAIVAPPSEREELIDQQFATQADAESWVGEIWAELADAGVDAVTLMEHDRVVYGPMSLHS